MLEFLTSIATGAADSTARMLAPDVVLTVVGECSYAGKERTVERLLRDSVDELEVLNILSHGDRCAANGKLQFSDGRRADFNNIYSFSGFGRNALLKYIDLYSIDQIS